ncbi:hypothetical protein M0802_003834 [Mischocyttarus mexicanus]|nr:hypothetical protein M0802_016527 [Mischocyttarus mexicanus]KAI4501031.1 hypothetical protein M0802_003834 [Mischocyttarus mexicanus]
MLSSCRGRWVQVVGTSRHDITRIIDTRKAFGYYAFNFLHLVPNEAPPTLPTNYGERRVTRRKPLTRVTGTWSLPKVLFLDDNDYDYDYNE